MATRLYREVPTPKVNNNYVTALVMLTIGDTYDRGKVIRGKRYSDGNSVGRRNDNSILDTHEYRVEFDDGWVSKMTTNFIAEFMYAACGGSGN